jgi:hypothetical protein
MNSVVSSNSNEIFFTKTKIEQCVVEFMEKLKQDKTIVKSLITKQTDNFNLTMTFFYGLR